MAVLLFDPGKLLLGFSVVLIFVMSSEATYTCTYIDRTGCCWPWSQEVEKTKQCTYGCCGEGVDQECCPSPDEDNFYNKLWFILAAVSGGLVVLCLIVIVVLCCLKKKNVARAKIYDGSDGSELTANRASPRKLDVFYPQPPYSPVNVFIVRDGQYQQRSAEPTRGIQSEPSGDDPQPHFNDSSQRPFSRSSHEPYSGQRPFSGSSHEPFSDHTRPPSSRISRGPSPPNDGRDQGSWPLVFNGEVGNPPPYSYIDSNQMGEWRRWETYPTKDAK